MRCAVLLAALAAAPVSAQQYQFVINPVPSGISGTLSTSLDTTGTLIGNYDEVSNPTGTRTKPGIFGTFGATENVPVPATVGLSLGGNLNSDTGGGFLLGLNTPGGTLSISGYTANFLKSGPVELPVTLSLLYDSFRTRTPSSTYIGGIPLNLPIGNASITQLSAQQTGSAPGTLTPTGPNTYDFTVAPIVELMAEVTVLGNTFTIPGTPTPLLLQGSITVNGNTAQLLSVQPVEFTNSTQPGLTLPQIPLDLPTILPPGDTAHLLLDLTLSQIQAGLNATLTTNAIGTLVPSPACAPVLILLAVRRRRPAAHLAT